ncbi:hypothetical protein D3C86_1566180 [compost metagenome]
MEIEPEEGAYSPTIIFSSVDFPVPLAPIRPILSPGLMCQSASSYNALEPSRNVKSFIEIIWLQKYNFALKFDGI